MLKSRLYAPGRIGTLTTKNRIIMTAMHTALSDSGMVNTALLEYFRMRAEGGAGMIVVGAAGIDPERINTHNLIGIHDDEFIPGLRRLTETIHRSDCRCMLQLFHPGRYARSSEYGGKTAVAPSAVPSRFTGETPRELTTEEIESIIGYYVEAASRARRAGFDGIEITAASGYLPAQFLSPLTNRRADGYGGDLEGRMIFLRKIIRRIHRTERGEFPLIVRIGASDFLTGGSSTTDMLNIARVLETEGVDAVSVTGGWHESPMPQLTMDVPKGYLAPYARRIRQAVEIPVIVSNRMTPQTAEDLVDSESADFIGFARALLADPAMPEKAAEGCYSTVRPCIACNQGCMDRIFFGKTIACAVNPDAGRESAKPEAGTPATTDENSLSVLIIGGGVSGLVHALSAAHQGYAPEVWEEQPEPGGQIRIAVGLEQQAEIARFIDYLVECCRSHDIPIVCSRQGTSDNIREAVESGRFDKVVLATGRKPASSPIDTDGSVPIFHAWDILRGASVPGRRIVVAGGSGTGVRAALNANEKRCITASQYSFLSTYGDEIPELPGEGLPGQENGIVLVEAGHRIAADIGPSSRWVYLSHLKRAGISARTGYEIVGIRDRTVRLKDSENRIEEVPVDCVIDALSYIQDRGLFDAASASGLPVSLLGGTIHRGSIMNAVRLAAVRRQN